jgi:pilus assembly protein CpaB
MRPLFARPSMLGAMLALLVGGGVYTYVNETQAAAGPRTARVAVVVAIDDIPARSRIEATQLRLKEVPADAVHTLAARTPDQVVGKFTTRAIRADEQLLAPDVSAVQTGSDLAHLVKPGMRAMAFGVSDASAAGGFVSPGDRIDVIAVFNSAEAAVAIASDLEVLAFSSALLGSTPPTRDPSETNNSPTSVNATVTVAVSPDVAARIAIGEVLGVLRVVVRNTGDTGVTAATPVDLKQLLGALAGGPGR